MKKIPIAFCVDNKYILQTLVVINSIEKNKKKTTCYMYFIFMNEECSEKNQERLNRIKSTFKNININVIITEKKLLEKAQMGMLSDYISSVTYIRLYLPFLLLNVDKCIYLDTDVLVLDDLSNLYNIDLDKFCVAGVRDVSVSTNKIDERKKSLQIPSLDNYINAGVLLLNLKKIREEYKFNLFKEEISRGYKFQDQDIINKCFFDKIKKIQFRYNVINRYINRPDVLNQKVYSIEDIVQGVYKPAIIHFTGERKPWIFDKSKGSKLWWEYANEILNDKENKYFKQEIIEYKKKLSFSFLLEKCGKNVIVWGLNDAGKILSERLNLNNVNIVAWADNNIYLQGNNYNGKKIIGINQFENYKYDSVIIAAQNRYSEIRNQLIDFGIEKNKIYRYIYLNENFYMSLDDNENH